MMLLIFLFNQLLAQNITEQKANYEKLLDTQELFIEFGMDLVILYNLYNFFDFFVKLGLAFRKFQKQPSNHFYR